ncbi:MAG: hypothetical protein Q4C00_00565 [Bacillota bacterium]|nr:hypothetical protein [Bacillota bacterium]
MYKFYLITADGREAESLPVNPETLEITWGADNEKYSLLKTGELVLPGHSRCKTISFSSWLPYSAAPRETILRWNEYIQTKRVLRLLIMGKPPQGYLGIDWNIPVIFEKITVREEGGEPGVLFFDLSFKEYRTFSLKVIS